jgi:DNA-binding HxlR family transcriptional regulator
MELTLDVLGGKWKTVILCFLNQRSCRYAELRKRMPNLSDKILPERLTDLVDSGLVCLEVKPGNRAIL